MSTWNYRIMKRKFPSKIHKGSLEEAYGLHEVYYPDDSGTPDGWTEDSMIGYFDSPSELRKSLSQMLSDVCTHDDVLDYEKGEK